MVKIRKQNSSKNYNRKSVLNLIRNIGVFTIAELSEKVGLSKLTIQKIIDFLMEQELVINIGKGESTQEGGKKPKLYRFNPEAYYAVGLQISPNTLRSIITDLKANQLESFYLSMDFNSSEDVILKNISHAYATLLSRTAVSDERIIGVGIGVPGVTNINQGTIITSPHTPVWGENFNLEKLLEDNIFELKTVFVDNSVRFQALAEKMQLSKKKHKTTVVLSTGVGTIAGIIFDNTIFRGRHHLAGHIGHMVIDAHDTERCRCGNTGCFEVLVSTERLLNKTRNGYRDQPDSSIFFKKRSSDITVKDVFKASNERDPFAMSLMDEISLWFSIGIHNIILFYDPDTIIISGIYSEAGDYLLNNIRSKMAQNPFSRIKDHVNILYSFLGDESAAVGAAGYIVERFFEY
jgi:N-acetylglucosamine repressor